MGSSISQSAYRRACQETESFRKSGWYFWAFEVVGAAVFGVVGALVGYWLTPPDFNQFWQFAWPTIGGGIGIVIGIVVVFLVIFGWNLFRAPYKQRNNARQRIIELETELEKPKLFDIRCPTKSLGLPINRLPDGSYIGSHIGFGFSQLSILHRGELTTINQISMSPIIWFMQGDKRRESSSAIQVKPGKNPFAGPRTKGFTWDISNPQQWELTGLPVTLAEDESLTLPMMELLVCDGNEAGNHFEKGETCQLIMKFSIRTDRGFPTLPDQIISLMRSDIKNSLSKLDFQPKPEEAAEQ